MLDLAGLLAARTPGRPLLLDGAMGSALIARGLAQGQPPERWTLERPDQVEEVHRLHLAAGSAVIQSNTFGANDLALARHGLGGRMVELNAAAVRIARRAAEQAAARDGVPRWVAGNIGPAAAPVGEADPDHVTAVFGRQAAALEAAGADSLSIETMYDLREALWALRGALRATDLPVTVCLTIGRTDRGFSTPAGDRMEDAARSLAAAGATAVGLNCSVGSAVLLDATPLLVAACPVPVIIKPNAGLPEVTSRGLLYRQEPEAFARDMAAAASLGAAAVGGCCGTDDRFIAALARVINTPQP